LMLEITSKLAAIFCKYKTVSCNSCNDTLLLTEGFVDLIGYLCLMVCSLSWLVKIHILAHGFCFIMFEAAISNSWRTGILEEL
jgi:hypothetical protein